jgi:hypothetical protein
VPTTDNYGQGISLSSMTDAPNIPDAIKALADGVIPRGVLRFASASTRGATLVGAFAPVDGMFTLLQDVKRLDVRLNGAWVAVSVGASTWTTITPASGYTQNGNSNGTFQYRLLNISGEESLQLRGGLARTYSGTPVINSVVNATALPSAVRPSTRRTVLIACSDSNSDRLALKMDVRTDGFLEVFGFGATAKPPWLSFNGVTLSL